MKSSSQGFTYLTSRTGKGKKKLLEEEEIGDWADKGSSDKASSYSSGVSGGFPHLHNRAENRDTNNLSFFTGQLLQDKARKYPFLSLRVLCVGPKAHQTSVSTDQLGCGVPMSPFVAVGLLVSDSEAVFS